MEQSLIRSRRIARRPLSSVARAHVAALVAMALAFVYLQVLVVGEYLLVPTILIGLTVVVAALAALGRRWTAALGTLWLALVMLTSWQVIAYHLARPENTHDFAFYVVVLAIAVVGLVCGVAAARSASVGAAAPPRWLSPLLLAVAMLASGAIAVVLIPRPAAASVSQAVLADLPRLTTANFAFDRTELRARVGETVALRLENADTATHAFSIPELGVNVPMHRGESSLALFRPTAPGTYTFVCSVPHHEAMRGTLIVTQ